MKTKIKIILLLIIANLSCLILEQNAFSQQVSVNFQMFYDQLSPYGRWIDHPNHGHVWIPSVGVGFMPYQTSGHWIYTNFGWTWASDYPWGWAPFHYGRWFLDSVYGWMWIPGNEWGPAWVVWSHSPGYYGWAPLAPGISISLALGGGWNVPQSHWIFVQDRYLCDSHLDRHFINRSRYPVIINNVKIINNSHTDNTRHITYLSGPERSEYQRIVPNQKIRTYNVQEINKPTQIINKNQIQIYKPNIVINRNEQTRPANLERYNANMTERNLEENRNPRNIQNQQDLYRSNSNSRRIEHLQPQGNIQKPNKNIEREAPNYNRNHSDYKPEHRRNRR